jgi:hypothetical protein
MKILQGEKLPIQKWSTFGASDATQYRSVVGAWFVALSNFD